MSTRAERRRQLIGFGSVNGSLYPSILAQLRPVLAQTADWHTPATATKRIAGPRWSTATLAARLRPLLEREAEDNLEPFLRAMRRRLERDRDRVHAYHSDLRDASLKRLVARVDADRRRETLRVEAIEHEYRANKLDDLRRNYAMRVTIEWIQALEICVPVQRLEMLIRRRKGNA